MDRKKLGEPVGERNFLAQMAAAIPIASQKQSVAIVCWDGAHNPVGRARVLYDIASPHRPTVLVAYLHDEFGSEVWRPLQRWAGNLIAIPWSQRHVGHALLRQYGINFDTVWICKPRLPSFQLAAAISHSHTRYILDIDDDEEAFIRRQTESLCDYDAPGLGLANYLRDNIANRTVSGPALQKRFGGHLIRHVRAPLQVPPAPREETINIGFIGTVRDHKNVLQLARAVRMLAADGKNLAFHIYGDVQPPSLRDDLENAGAIIHGPLQFSALPGALAKMHVLVSGFPVSAQERDYYDASAAQVPAKIFDALAAGRPVLVPASQAVADLENVTGIHLFTEADFPAKLKAALESREHITLPQDFTPSGAFPVFVQAEKAATHVKLPITVPVAPYAADAAPAIVLVWKQRDAALYGGRLDQIARSCRHILPDYRLFVLEFSHKSAPEPALKLKNVGGEEEIEPVPVLHAGDFELTGDFEIEASLLEEQQPDNNYFDDASLLSGLAQRKTCGLVQDGASYRLIEYKDAVNLQNRVMEFLASENLRIDNTLFVLFPVIDELENIEDILRPYIKIADIVDNELGWASDGARAGRLLDQYFRIVNYCSHVVFSSQHAQDFFTSHNFCDSDRTKMIPNWYETPPGFIPKFSKLDDHNRHLFYSGNMNDRIDWQLLRRIVEMPGVKIHLVGTCKLKPEQLAALIADGAIYHGATTEKETLELLTYMDAAIIPLLPDDISRYMDPIKVCMYRAVGLPVICPACMNFSGTGILAFETPGQCQGIINTLPERKHCQPLQAPHAAAYAALIKKFHPASN